MDGSVININSKEWVNKLGSRGDEYKFGLGYNVWGICEILSVSRYLWFEYNGWVLVGENRFGVIIT